MEQEKLNLTQGDDCGDEDDEQSWGVYDKKPSTEEPQGDLYIEWVYIVDLDNNCFTVKSGSGWSRVFKLENLPRNLFEEYLSEEEVLTMPISLENLYITSPPTIGYDAAHLARFARHAPHLSKVDVPQEETHFTASEDLNSWKPLTQLLLELFLERYITFFKELVRPENQAIFDSTGLDGYTAATHLYKQLAFGIINLCDSPRRIKFRKGSCRYKTPGKHDQPQRPRWECPQKNSTWMDEVLVILEPRIAVQEFLHAAIGKAIDLLGRQRTGTTKASGMAVIFSIQALVIVAMNYDNLGEPDITYSQTLPVITPSECSWYRCFGGLRTDPPAGLAALIDAFARQRDSYSLPAGLPFEICAKIYKLSRRATRKSLAASCRVFRVIETECPRIGKWELLHTWNHGNVGFVASAGPGLTNSVVSLEECRFRGTGFCVGLFRGGYHIDLDLPWLVVVNQQSEGFEGCHCCVGLPILSKQPAMMGRLINMDRYDKEREEDSSSHL